MSIPADKVIELCDAWYASVASPSGNISIGAESEKFRLFNNGVKFHQLELDAFRASCVGLSKVLLLPGLNTFIVEDHVGLWSWGAELMLHMDSGVFTQDEMELQKLFETCARAALSNCNTKYYENLSREEQSDADKTKDLLISHHSKYFLQNAHLTLAYLSFPLLEGVCKKIASEYISMDGRVKKEFSAPPRKEGQTPRFYKVGQTCSSLRDLLFLMYELNPSEELNLIREHLSSLHTGQDAFDVVYSWRNQSLHGSTTYQTIGGTIFNLVLLLLTTKFENSYNEKRQLVLDHCIRISSWDVKPHFSYYPPR
ncbi:hypothetical protein [Vibrio splendidus]|uniref:hypothetical protein n=1 Tax=Vibrio splendidus TaxID=29497 RepID=UPI003D128903